MFLQFIDRTKTSVMNLTLLLTFRMKKKKKFPLIHQATYQVYSYNIAFEKFSSFFITRRMVSPESVPFSHQQPPNERHFHTENFTCTYIAYIRLCLTSEYRTKAFWLQTRHFKHLITANTLNFHQRYKKIFYCKEII